MPDRSDVIYVYDGSFDGFLCAIFEAFESKETPSRITTEHGCQVTFSDTIKNIETEPEKSDRIADGIQKKLGQACYERVYYAYLSLEEDAGRVSLVWLRKAFREGSEILLKLNEDIVIRMDTLKRRVGREAHLLRGFVRFSEMENGVYFSEISPQYNVLPIIMPHFAERYNTMPFLLHDKTHMLAGIYDTKEWYLTSSEGLEIPDYAPREKEYRRLWKTFYDTIGIKERYNPRCRMRLMPKYFWKNMTEFKD